MGVAEMPCSEQLRRIASDSGVCADAGVPGDGPGGVVRGRSRSLGRLDLERELAPASPPLAGPATPRHPWAPLEVGLPAASRTASPFTP